MRSPGIALALLATVGLLGCVPEVEPGPPPSSEPEFEPVFASDEEALAAAEEAYGEYVRLVDDGFMTGSTDDLIRVAAGEALEKVTRTIREFAEAGKAQVGRTTSEDVQLVTYDASGWVQVYACLRVSEVDVLDQNGNSLVLTNRPDRYPMQVEMETQEAHLVVTSAEVWSGHDFCN